MHRLLLIATRSWPRIAPGIDEFRSVRRRRSQIRILPYTSIADSDVYISQNFASHYPRYAKRNLSRRRLDASKSKSDRTPWACYLNNLKLSMNARTKFSMYAHVMKLCKFCFKLTASRPDRADAFHSFEHMPWGNPWGSLLQQIIACISKQLSGPGCLLWPAFALPSSSRVAGWGISLSLMIRLSENYCLLTMERRQHPWRTS